MPTLMDSDERPIEVDAGAATEIFRLRAEVERLRAALQDIADDPIVRPHREERRGISEILTIARNAIDAARAGDAAE